MHTISWLLTPPLACPDAAAAPRGEIRWFNGFGSGEREGREEEAAGGDVMAGARFRYRLPPPRYKKAPAFKELLSITIIIGALSDILFFHYKKKTMPRLAEQRKKIACATKSLQCFRTWQSTLQRILKINLGIAQHPIDYKY